MKSVQRVLLIGIVTALLFAGFSVTVVAGSDLIILHSNDIHGRIEMDEGLLGMPYIGAIIADYRERYDHILVMDAGDTIHGRPITNTLDGTSAVDAMNAAGYDIMVPGNHDFNFGYERLLELEEKMEFDLVAANVFKDDELLFNPYVIREMGEYKIGVFGLATPDTYSTTHPDNIVGIEFGDMVEAADKYVDILRNEYEVDLVVALGHVGFARNYPSTDVAREVEGIDLFVDGHSHSRLPEGEWHYGTLFVQAHEYSKYFGRVQIDLSDEEPVMEAALLSPDDVDHLEPVPEIIELLEEARDEARKKMLGL